MHYLLDTNVLLRLVAVDAIQHRQATAAVRKLLSEGADLLVAPQVLMEFWSVATRPIDVNGYGWSPGVAAAQVAALLAQFPLIPETPAVFALWLQLVVAHGRAGKQAHDTHLVALMASNNIRRLLTFNTADFSGYDIEAISPADITVA